MPTSAGTTRIAELAVAYTLIKDPGAKCIYIAPYRALVAELEGDFLNLFADLGFGVSTATGSYDSDGIEEYRARWEGQGRPDLTSAYFGGLPLADYGINTTELSAGGQAGDGRVPSV